MIIYCISGKARSGKDTTAEIMKEAFESNGKRVLIAHYADQVRHVCSDYFKWNGVKDEFGRGLLQHIGTDCVRSKYPDFWVNRVREILQLFNFNWDVVIIPDCRFPNEIELMRNDFTTRHISITRPNFESGLTAEQKNHISENALNSTVADIDITNDGSVDDLRKKISDLINFELEVTFRAEDERTAEAE